MDSKELVKKVNDFKKEKIDLSSGEDLSIALMNLVSLEEHFYFTAMKTNKKKYLGMLNEIREMRKVLLKEIVKNPKGEEWCISKHLLATSMRLIEVGNKYMTKKNEKKANEMFRIAYDIYNMFWTVNLDLVKDKEILYNDSGWKSKVNKLLKKIIDCCKE